MPCHEWKHAWVAKLYDEIDDVEERELTTHLAQCSDCRATLDDLERTRVALRTSETVAPTPAASRVVVLNTGRHRAPAWHVAAGWAASVLVFVVGLYLGSRLPGREPIPSEARADRPAADRATSVDLSSFEARLAALERGEAEAAAARDSQTRDVASEAVVTDAELGAELDRLARKLRGERARDMDFLLGEISATEWRAGKWIDETREAVRYVALRDDGRFSER